MYVSVHHKRGQRRLRAAKRASFLGDGILERARSTSLALLGATAALGLAIVALALNQSWPLVPGSPIPGFGENQEAVGDAAIAAQARAAGAGGRLRGAAEGQRSGRSGQARHRHAGRPPKSAGSPRHGAAGVVVSHSVSVRSPAGNPPSATSPAPVSDVPAPAAAPVATPTPEPVATPAAVPASSVPQSTQQPPTPSQSAVEPGESEAHDRGHHEGRPESPGHGRHHGGPDPGESESGGDVEPPANVPVVPPGGSESNEGSESESQPPSSSHGGGHGHGHGHW